MATTVTKLLEAAKNFAVKQEQYHTSVANARAAAAFSGSEPIFPMHIDAIIKYHTDYIAFLESALRVQING